MLISNIIKLIILGSLSGFFYGFSLIYIQKLRKSFSLIIYNLRNLILIILLFYILHLFKISSIIFIISFILTFWVFIIKY